MASAFNGMLDRAESILGSSDRNGKDTGFPTSLSAARDKRVQSAADLKTYVVRDDLKSSQ